jgi:signal peptidase I
VRTAVATLRRSQLVELAVVVVVALGLALTVQAYAVKPYRIPSESMLPTLKIGDRVLVNRFSHRMGAEPKVGQVVVFTPPEGAVAEPAVCGVPDQPGRPCPKATRAHSSTAFIKRVVAVAGDTITIAGGHVLRNGVRERDPYALACGTDAACDLPRPITIPPGNVFLMGDNRGNSDDSRFWGPIPTGWVIGEAVTRYWPLSRFGAP